MDTKLPCLHKYSDRMLGIQN